LLGALGSASLDFTPMRRAAARATRASAPLSSGRRRQGWRLDSTRTLAGPLGVSCAGKTKRSPSSAQLERSDGAGPAARHGQMVTRERILGVLHDSIAARDQQHLRRARRGRRAEPLRWLGGPHGTTTHSHLHPGY
jgi:hypothetical protein